LLKTQEVLNFANMVIGLIENTKEQQEELTRLKELNREMVEVLEQIEWLEVWDDYVDGPIFNCPVCGSLDIKGHHESCELGKLLAKAEGEVPPGIVVGYNFKKMKESEGE